MSNTSKRLTQEQLSEILDLHGKWFRGEPGGVRADLQNTDLKGAFLEYVNLRGANLEYTFLEGANLKGANLEGASLRRANLEGASLRRANLKGAFLEYVNLEGANLKGANLKGANLKGANLRGAYMEGAFLEGANLPSPVIDLTDCTVGFKKVRNRDKTKQVVIELRFPAGSKLVSTVIGRKCRASEAAVVRCVSTGHQGETEFWSLYADLFPYRVGETVKPTEPFDDSITVECTSGIHFFVTREEAEAYNY